MFWPVPIPKFLVTVPLKKILTTLKINSNCLGPKGDVEVTSGYNVRVPESHVLSSLFLQEFVVGLSVLARGTPHEKLQWAFTLYDINGDGIITKDEMTDIVSAIYEMIGSLVEPCVDERTAKQHVEKVFHVSRKRCGE